MKTLLLFRHAKSDWGDAGLPDFERPLNHRGQKAAERMGRWMKEAHIQPEWIVSSPAKRAVETVAGLRKHLDIPDTLVQFDERIYMADVPTLVDVAARCPEDMDNIMLVGHNPGMDDLLTWLCGPDLPRSSKGKLMATATLAQINMPDDWQQLAPNCGKLQQIVRPGEID
jgi:phosphohistidine phosphatase